MSGPDAPYHAHIYFSDEQRPAAEALHDEFASLATPGEESQILFVGRMTDGPAGPHPVPQYEIHFHGHFLPNVLSAIGRAGLRALVHPLTDDDMADHTALAHWIGEPLDLDLTVLDPPGVNQGIPRFGKTDF